MTRLLASAAVIALLALSPSVSAQGSDPLEAEAVRIYKTLPRHSTILQVPSVDAYTSYGESGQTTVKADVPGGQARQYRIAKAGANPWDAAIQLPNAVAIAKGDVIHASFWARAKKLPKGESVARVPVSLQQNGEPYAQIAYTELDFTEEWQLHAIAGEAMQDFGPGGMVLNLQASAAAQTLEMGPAFLNTLGPGAVPGEDGVASAPPTKTPSSAATGPVDIATLSKDIRRDVKSVMGRLPSGAQLISKPVDTADVAYGGTARMVDDSGVPGGRALEVTTPRVMENSWDVGVNLPITEGVAQGDVLLLAVWAKAIEAKNESQTAVMQPIRIQESGGDYKSAAEGAAYLSRDWKLYYVPAKSDVAFGAGDAGLGYHLGLAPQTIRIGPSYLFKLPQGTDERSLPQNEINYAGRALDAPWRADAMRRIDAHRKADLTVVVRDAAGNPIPNADVRVEQTRHAFKMGSFTGHEYKTPATSDERNWHRIFDANFNTVTLPIYWADWGWAGPGSSEDKYKDAIEFAAEKGLPWRAHTVMWPGERYMPKRFLAEMSPKARRKMVQDHIREVVTHIRDAELPPYAVDFTNEPRNNRYFQENGDPDFVEDMFKFAHDLAPDLPLFINDYGILNNGGSNTGSIAYYHEWIRNMLGKGVPLGGIGFQGHFSAGLTPPERLIEILEDFAQYDLPLHITEFDVETLDDNAQADYTRDILLASLSVEDVDAFIFWQFWEGDHWKPNAAMLRNDWSEKPAYGSLRKLMFQDLWTDTTVRTDASGQTVVRAMQGEYRVTVNGKATEVTLDADGEALTLTAG